MFCSKCGNKISDGAPFCEKCGAKVNGVQPSDSKGILNGVSKIGKASMLLAIINILITCIFSFFLNYALSLPLNKRNSDPSYLIIIPLFYLAIAIAASGGVVSIVDLIKNNRKRVFTAISLTVQILLSFYFIFTIIKTG